MERARKLAPKFTRRSFTRLSREAIHAFDTLPLVGEGTKPRVGVVGGVRSSNSIPRRTTAWSRSLSPTAAEAVVPGLLDFFLYSMSNAKVQKDYGEFRCIASHHGCRHRPGRLGCASPWMSCWSGVPASSVPSPLA